MIAFFPEKYPDELLYSLFARYHVWSGHARYSETANDLFENRFVHGDPEFTISMNEQAKTILTRNMPFEDLIAQTTMFNYYAAFLNPKNRVQAIEILKNNCTGIHKTLRIGQSRNQSEKFLRYCPECVRRDREKYGETYWHRNHQMRGIPVCPEHGYKLISSSVSLNLIKSPNLYPAEQVIGDSDSLSEETGTDTQRELALYTAGILGYHLDNTEYFPGQVIKSRLYGTKYASPRGGLIKCESLLSDMQKYYSEDKGDFLSRQQLYDTLRGVRIHTDEICRIACFLRIPMVDLLSTKPLPDVGPEAFDAKVLEMRKKNIPYKQIAKELNASLELVKPIGTGRYRSYSQASGEIPKQRKKTDWNQVDRDFYPAVSKEVRNRLNCGKQRPKRICIGTICRAVGIRREKLLRMPTCLKVVNEYYETWEQFWEREIQWAIIKLREDDKNINATSIEKLTGIKKHNIIKVLSHL